MYNTNNYEKIYFKNNIFNLLITRYLFAEKVAGKKKKQSLFIVILKGLLLGVLAVLAVYITIHNVRTARYTAFGISIPAGYKIHGIDVSHHQDDIEWKEVKKMRSEGTQVGFAFIKATEGMTRVDDHFRSNWRHANDAHIHRGAYHFFLADRSASKQAAHFISTVTLKSGDLPPVLDVEGNMGAGTETIRNGVKEWLSLIEQHFGIKPIIYTNIDFYEKYLAGQFDDYPLWVAHYIKQRKPRISRNWLFWQHSEKGRVNGIDYPVDFNVFNGDSSDFQNLLIR
jgi:lysozyme